MRYEVEAFNSATESVNKIHDDAVAREYGFRGGLVPGVDVYAYMTRLPAELWGLDWLAAGRIDARFLHPVYDGERVAVTGERQGDTLRLTVTGPDAVVRATGQAALGESDLLCTGPVPPWRPLPEVRPPASPESLRPGADLGTVEVVFHADSAPAYLAAVREELPLYREHAVAHPGWLLRLANTFLAENVALGPWIHVMSSVGLCGPVRDRDALEVRGTVTGEFERKGHRFVELSVAVLAEGRVVQRVAHTAIHTPRHLQHSA